MLRANRERIEKGLYLILRFFMGAVFAYAGFSKLMEPAANIRAVMARYEVIPDFLIPQLSAVVPWLEWILGMFILLGYLPRLSYLAAGLFSGGFVFVIAASGMLLGNAGGSCGCFGEGGLQISTRQIFLVDLMNCMVAFRFALLKNHPFSLQALLARKTPERT